MVKVVLKFLAPHETALSPNSKSYLGDPPGGGIVGNLDLPLFKLGQSFISVGLTGGKFQKIQ